MGYVGEPDIDLTGAFVMPGWIDMHVHIASQQSPDRFLEKFTLEPADSALRAVPYAERTLLAGFHHRARSRHRPRAGPIHPPGGRRRPHRRAAHLHRGQESRHHRRPCGSHQRRQQRTARRSGAGRKASSTGLDDAYKAVRARYKEGSDLIKITATGGVLSQAASGENPQFTEAEIACHRHGGRGLRISDRCPRPRLRKA